jgi:hypothetical protein
MMSGSLFSEHDPEIGSLWENGEQDSV